MQKKDAIINIKYGQHLLSCILNILYNVCFATYLIYKAIVIKSNWLDTLKHPWLLIVLGCEFMYFLSSLISLVQTLIPPSKRPLLKLTDEGPFPSVDIFITCLIDCCK